MQNCDSDSDGDSNNKRNSNSNSNSNSDSQSNNHGNSNSNPGTSGLEGIAVGRNERFQFSWATSTEAGKCSANPKVS